MKAMPLDYRKDWLTARTQWFQGRSVAEEASGPMMYVEAEWQAAEVTDGKYVSNQRQ
jgi:hypothetical protein